MKTKAKKPTSPILALAYATLAERRNEPSLLAAAIRKAASKHNQRHPETERELRELIKEYQDLTRTSQTELAEILKHHGQFVVQNIYFQDYVLDLQTAFLHALINAITWAKYLTGSHDLRGRNARSERFHALQGRLHGLLSPSKATQPAKAAAAA
ncbi:MAG: hypothetical protein ABSG50_01560 [Opitutaceae bacterium]|jgi:hypothetical protein